MYVIVELPSCWSAGKGSHAYLTQPAQYTPACVGYEVSILPYVVNNRQNLNVCVYNSLQLCLQNSAKYYIHRLCKWCVECCPIPPPHCVLWSMQVCDLLDANRRMQEELMEKDQAIKVLQQKMADLKKTLQKELVWSPYCVVFSKCSWVLLPYSGQCVSRRCRNPSPLPRFTGKAPKIFPIAVSVYPLPPAISSKKPMSATSTSNMWSWGTCAVKGRRYVRVGVSRLV